MANNENKRKKPISDSFERKKVKPNSNENNLKCSTSDKIQQGDLSQLSDSEPEIQSIVEENNNVKQSQLTKQNSNGLEEMLICNICQEIMYNCVSIQPCLHSYCAYCLLKWRKSGECCPSCRGLISGVSINHLVRNIIDKYLSQHPEKSQSLDERKEADLEVAKNMNILFSAQQNSTPFVDLSLNNCPFCNYPGNPIYTQSSINMLNYSCNSNTNHTQCSCCSRNIPNLPNNDIYPPVSCEICNDKFCFLLLDNCTECITGCLFTFKNFVFNTDLNDLSRVPQFIPDNFYETNVLRNYLIDQNITVTDMYTEIFHKLSRGEISLGHHALVETTPLCLRCAKKAMLDLVFEYFVSIPKTNLPQEVTARPNCYYGKNCRTQRHKLTHCSGYNHACPQTKF